MKNSSIAPARLTNSQVVSAQVQISRDQIEWAKTRTSDRRELIGYEAGIAAGAREMLSFLKLHGYIEVFDR